MTHIASTQYITLSSFLAKAALDERVPAGLVTLIESVADACSSIATAVERGVFDGASGIAHSENVHGEAQKKLDVVSNDIMISTVESIGCLRGLASEELESVQVSGHEHATDTPEYLLLFDPLDGSSNLEINGIVGSIFSVLAAPVSDAVLDERHFLQPGVKQVCAGYAIYGATTMFVLTTGYGVDGFTFDRESASFVLTHSQLQIPENTCEFAINMSNERYWEEPVRRYVRECVAGASGPRQTNFNMRWIASMVAEVHRILMRGGVFLYPRDNKNPQLAGRLRLTYEANPMSFIVEQAGGMSTTGEMPIMEVQPDHVHQRVPVILGSRLEVERLIRYHDEVVAAWSSLQTHYEKIRDAHMRDWFAPENDPAPTRAERFALAGGGLAADFSKNRITDETLKLLVQLAREAGVEKRRDAMFAGEVVNPTEGRAALHTALRATDPKAPFHAEIQAERAKMAAFADKVRSGEWTGYTGKRIRYVVNIGIGGSDLGPKMVVHALHHLATPEITTHFVSNVDGADLYNMMQQIDPEETLAIIVSKTFTTLETMTNARSLRDWFIEKGCPESALAKHFVGVSANPSEVVRFGIAKENVFEMWDWVGGRYSLWSAVGLSIMIAIGPKQFDELLAGANEMDQHFRDAPLEKNLPVLLGMIGIWYRNFFGSQSYLVAPYSEALHFLPSYLQQLEMESNGKSARLDGVMVDYPTAAVTWGEPGTNGQHAFFQMLHQGPTIVPIDFIAVLTPEHPLVSHHPKLLANCFAQSEALMLGRTLEEAKKVAGADKPELAPHLVFPGNRPTSTLLVDALTARSLGALIALYEHKVLVQASVWDINPFDQWGVELGKILGKVVEADLTSASVDEKKHDSSTSALIARARAALKR